VTSTRVALVDDEEPARDRLRRLLGDHADFTVVGEAWDVASAVELLDREHPDLCFLDVQMPGGSGFDVIRRARHAPHVIFTTAYDQYAVQAFEISSVDYLLKPFSAERFASALGRARDRMDRDTPSAVEIVRLLEEIRSGLPGHPAAPTADGVLEPTGRSPAPTRIPVRRGAKILLLDPPEVHWFEAEDALVFAHTEEGRFLVDRSLADLEDLLAGAFFRTHRQYLVNLARIGEIRPAEAGTYRIHLRDGARSELPLSRRQARRLRETMPW